MRRQLLPLVGMGLLLAGGGGAQTAPPPLVERDDMIVDAPAIYSSRIAGQDASIATTLRLEPRVDLQTQGVPGGQSDISIRGSSFSGAGIALNGLALPNAQTEHFNAELPIASGLLSAPSVHTGFDQVLESPGFLVGTVDFSILPVDTSRSLMLGVSEKEGYWVNVLMQQRYAVKTGSMGLGAFGGVMEANAVDLPDNDVRSKRAGGQGQWIDGAGGQWDVLIARQEKRFGARGYYGVTPDWAADEETVDTLIYSGWSKAQAEGGRIRASLMYREQTDDYTLYWPFPGVFNNAHRLSTYGGMVDWRWMAGERGLLDWRVDGSHERIRSSALGDHERAQAGVTAVPGLYYRRWLMQAGGRLAIFEDATDRFLPQVSARYRLSDAVDMRIAYSETVRQPSYTELNYESPASLGNQGLENQTAATTEFVVEGAPGGGFSWRTGVFYQQSQDEVDWIRETEDSARFEARNIGEIDTAGVEIGGQWLAHRGHRLRVHYTGLSKDSDAELHASRYALDYPKHHLKLSGLVAVGSRVALELFQHVRRHDDNPLRESSQTGYDASMTLHVVALKQPQVQFSLSVHNLWDDDFETFAGQPTISPRRYSAGMTMDW